MQKNIFSYILIVLVAFIIFHGIFTEGYLVRSDHTVHLQRALFLKDNILNNHQITGWNHLDNLGSPFLIYTYIFSSILIVLINLVFQIPIHIAYKILVFLSFASIPLMLYFILSKKFNKPAAFISSMLFFFHKTTIQQILDGIWNQYFGIVFFLIFYYYLDKHSNHLKLKHVGILSLLLSVIIVSHLYVGMAALYLFGLYFLFKIRTKFSLLIPILSSLMISFYLAPLVQAGYWTINKITWGVADNFPETIYKTTGILLSLQDLKNITLQSLISNIPIFFLDITAIIGIMIYLKKRNNDFLKISLYFLVISTIIGTGFWFNFEKLANLPLLGTILSARFLILAKIPLFFFSAYALSRVKISKFNLTLLTIALVLFSLILFQPTEDLLKTSENSPELNDYFNTIDYLKTLENKNRIVFQSPYRTTELGLITPLNIASQELQTPVIGAWTNPSFPISESLINTNNKLFNIPIEEISEEQIVDRMVLYNANYLVSITPELTNKLNFTKIKSFNNHTIFYLDINTTTLYASHPFWGVKENILIDTKDREFNQNNIIFIFISLISTLYAIYLWIR